MEQQRNQKGQYKCEDCGKTFQTQNELNQHNSEQHGSKQHDSKQYGSEQQKGRHTSKRGEPTTRTAGGHSGK